MPASDYYTDVIDELPFSTVVDLYANSVPRFMATLIVGWGRLRTKLGFPAMPMYASLWDPNLEWQQRRDLPARSLSRMAPWIEKLEDRGFEISGWIKSEIVGNKEEVYCFLLNESGDTVAQLMWLRIGAIEQKQLTFMSYRGDGTELMTAGLPPEQEPLVACLSPEYVDFVSRSSEMPLQDLYRVHTERPEISAAISLTHETFRSLYRIQRERFFESCLERKVLRPLSDREFRYLKSVTR